MFSKEVVMFKYKCILSCKYTTNLLLEDHTKANSNLKDFYYFLARGRQRPFNIYFWPLDFHSVCCDWKQIVRSSFMLSAFFTVIFHNLNYVQQKR